MSAQVETRVAKLPPPQVWICWCDECGKVDYAYVEKPKESGAGCPVCETGHEWKKIAGPYFLVQPETERVAAVLEALLREECGDEALTHPCTRIEKDAVAALRIAGRLP